MADTNDLAFDTLFKNFHIATMDPTVSAPYGALHENAIGVTDGLIAWIGHSNSLPFDASPAEVIDGQGNWLTPGLIDCHTHLVYGGNRASEWEARLSGVSYEEIARSGGGILSSVKSTRNASLESLTESATKRLHTLMVEGVTTVEIKSGYGLDLETELKMLHAGRAAGQTCGVDVTTTLLGAHAIPPEYKNRADAYVDLVCQEIIPAAKIHCEAVDAFCESIAFNVEQTKRVLQTALDAGLNIKVHAEQLSNMGMAAEAAKMGALSADHLEYLTPDDCRVLGDHDTVATLLPGAFFCLQETQKPPIAALLENDVPIAIATDSNPGSSPVLSLLTVGNMACNLFRMTPEQTLAGMTRNAAKALGMADRGVIREGATADLAAWEVESPAELLYQIGGNPCVAVYKDGIRR